MRKIRWIISLGLLASQAYGENLEDIYQLAIQNDQTFQNETATRQATAETLPQALSVLFPALSGTGNTIMNRQWTSEGNPNFATPGLVKYNSHGYELNLTMPLIDFNDWYTVSQARATVKSADATYADAAQSLIIRTATAYFNVLQAQDNLENARAQKDLLAKQLAQSKARYQVGVDAITSVYNVQAQYDAAVALEISNESALYAAYQNLQVMTKKPIDHLSRLIDQLPLLKPNPESIDSWQKAAETRNFSLLALRYTAEAAHEGIKASNANHLPSISTVNSYTYNVQTPNASNRLGLQQTTSNLGLQLSVPIFQGGEVLSQTRQAQDQYVEAMTNMELQHRQITSQVFQIYSNIISGISKIEADRAAVKSANSALESNQAAYQAGTMTIVDVLTAVQNLYTAEQNYSADQYSYLLNTLTLKQLAGNLTNLDVVAINQYLKNGFTISAAQVEKEALTSGEDFKKMPQADAKSLGVTA